MKRRRLAVTLLVLAAGGVARAAGSEVTVDTVSFSIYDRGENRVVPVDKQPDEYGLDMDLMVAVKVKGTVEGTSAPTLTLTATSPAFSDEATGSHAAWKKKLERKIDTIGERGHSWFLFVIPFECRGEVTFVARAGKSEKKVKQMLACAE